MALRWAKVLGTGVAIIVVGAAAAWFVTKPKPLPPESWVDLGEPDLANGELLFWAGGCAGCHAATEASGDDVKVMSGGLALTSAFGTFHVPNISPDPQAGIGNWTLAEPKSRRSRRVVTFILRWHRAQLAIDWDPPGMGYRAHGFVFA